jgi:hypothetical protein
VKISRAKRGMISRARPPKTSLILKVSLFLPICLPPRRNDMTAWINLSHWQFYKQFSFHTPVF